MASNPFDKLNPQYWPSLPDDIDPKLRTALMQVFNAIDNHRKAFAALKSQQTTTQTQTETIVQTFQSGGNGNVFGPSSSTPGDAAVFADASGKQLSDVGYPPVSAAQVQNEAMFYADDTGGAANTYVAVLSPVVTTYVEGLRVALKIAHTSTGASTLDAGGGAVTIKKLTTTGLADIAASDLQAGDIYVFRYDGTFFQVQVAGGGGGLNGAVVKTASYAPSSADSGKLIVMNGSSLTLTLPNPVPSATWFILVQNINASDLTVARNSLTIDGAASDLTVGQNQGVVITTDGTNYDTERGLPTYGGDLAYLTGTTQKVVGILDKAIDASSPTDGQLPQYQSATGKWELVYVYQKSQGGVAGSPSASQPMCWANIIQPVAFAADFAGSQGMIDPGVGANPAATVTLTVKKWVSGVATTLGTISISTGGVFTFATTSHAAQSAGTGDLVAVYNQNPADASLAYPTFALAGYLGSTAPTNPIVSGGAVSGPVSSTNNDIALFDGTPGNVIKDSGVQISTDGTMASNSDSLVPTQKAVVTYVDKYGSGGPTTVTGLTRWFSADQISGLTDGTAITQWPDASPEGTAAWYLDATTGGSGHNPVYKTNILNSKPIIRFDGTGWLDFQAPFIAGEPQWTVFLVLKIASLTPSYTGILGSNLTADKGGYFIKSNGKTALYLTTSVYDGTGSFTFTTSAFHIISIIIRPNSITTRVDLADDKAATAFTISSAVTPDMMIGNQFVASRVFTGDIAEIMWYRRGLNSTDVSTVENYLKAKYGL